MNELGTINTKPRITIPEARKLLGSKFRHLDDDQVQEIIIALTLLARSNLQYISSNNTHGNGTI